MVASVANPRSSARRAHSAMAVPSIASVLGNPIPIFMIVTLARLGDILRWRYSATVEIAANVVVAVVALLHLYFLVLEMFLWTTPTGRRTFGVDADFAQRSKALAANQGLYNGFLAAGLVWGLFADDVVKVFFLVCVIVAGVFGAVTVNRRILLAQAAPAALGLVFVLLA